MLYSNENLRMNFNQDNPRKKLKFSGTGSILSIRKHGYVAVHSKMLSIVKCKIYMLKWC